MYFVYQSTLDQTIEALRGTQGKSIDLSAKNETTPARDMGDMMSGRTILTVYSNGDIVVKDEVRVILDQVKAPGTYNLYQGTF